MAGHKVSTLISEPLPLSKRSHAILTILTGTQTGRVINLSPGPAITLGREEECTLRFDDASVSGRHAQIGYVLGRYHFIDEGSTNGSAVNGSRVDKVWEFSIV